MSVGYRQAADKVDMLTRYEIAEQAKCNPRIIIDDLKHLKIESFEKGDNGANLYTEEDRDRVLALRNHCRSGKTRETFLESSAVEIVTTEQADIEPVNSMPVVETGWHSFIQSNLQTDMLYRCRILQDISDNSWLPPTRDLAAIIGIRPESLIERKKYNYWGFICVPEIKENNSWLWKIHANNS